MTDKDAGKQERKAKPSGAVVTLFQSEVDRQTTRLQELLKLKAEAGLERVDLAELTELLRAARGGAILAKVNEASELLEAMMQWSEYFAENWCQKSSKERDQQQSLIKKHIPVLLSACKCLQRIADDAVRNDGVRESLGKEASKLGSTLVSVKSSSCVEIPIDEPENIEPVELTTPDQDSASNVHEDESSESEALSQKKEVTPALLKIRDLFWKELEERVEVLTQHLLELEQGLSSDQRLETMMRMAHTIKGGARLADIDPVMKLAHTLEDIFVSAQKQEITINSNHTDLLLKGVDSIVQLSGMATQGGEVDTDALQNSVALRKELGKVLTAPESFKKPEKSEIPTPTSSEEPIATDVPKEEEASAERVIRVNAEKLNKVIGLAGELSVESRQLKKFWQENIKLRRSARSMNLLVEKCLELMRNYQLEESDRHYINELMRESLAVEEAVNHNCAVLEEYERKTTWLTDKLVRETLGHRMRPFREGTQGLLRLVRTVSHKLGKKVRLDIRGENTQVDRDILEQLHVPLTHLIQNAIDHGFESTEQRRERGKQEEGIITLEASHKAGLLVVTVKDDGGGVNRQKLRERILQKNMATEEMVANMSDSELYEFLLLPSFSLKEEVTTVSGRGVGMNLIHEMVQNLRGRIAVHSEEGKGSCFELLLPLTLSMLRCVVVEVAGYYYALPVGPLNKVLTFTADDIKVLENRQYVQDGSEGQLGLVSAHQLLELPENNQAVDHQQAVVLGRGTHQYAVTVDSVIGETTLVERPIDPRMGKIKDISSAAFLDDGTPILILDADDLVLSIERLVSEGRIDRCDAAASADERAASAKHVLVVDDSVTVRELEKSLLEDKGYRVDVAVDGADGWNAVRMNDYDLIVTDIDMPRMDGFGLISHIRGDGHLQHLPVIIISYKDRESDRKRGMEVGADHYLTKGSFMDETFISTVRDLIGSAYPDDSAGDGGVLNL
ncbi:hybrid sensor histidine kinase/response regulator [Endozoicomonas elysicola]|uniref:hybrid sensor histidine kinase/response regulator n=1 Tax=Endozoicomonas elysicola TaxID=305900 RepID=UPI0003739D04|nr:response regulator [Endozoicomonas elysicola]